MILDFAGAMWRVKNPAAMIAEIESKAPISRQRFVLGCEACKELCTIENPCRCCANIGTKAGGTGRVVRGIQNDHSRLPVGEVVEKMRECAA